MVNCGKCEGKTGRGALRALGHAFFPRCEVLTGLAFYTAILVGIIAFTDTKLEQMTKIAAAVLGLALVIQVMRGLARLMSAKNGR